MQKIPKLRDNEKNSFADYQLYNRNPHRLISYTILIQIKKAVFFSYKIAVVLPPNCKMLHTFSNAVFIHKSLMETKFDQHKDSVLQIGSLHFTYVKQLKE